MIDWYRDSSKGERNMSEKKSIPVFNVSHEEMKPSIETINPTAKSALDKMQLMCEQSLSPEVFEQWMNVRGWLEKTRNDLK